MLQARGGEAGRCELLVGSRGEGGGNGGPTALVDWMHHYCSQTGVTSTLICMNQRKHC